MSSPTLKAILEHWTGDPTEESSPLLLPFDIEEFCRKNDRRISDLEAENARMKEENVKLRDSLMQEIVDIGQEIEGQE